jgi:hypothetical protein
MLESSSISQISALTPDEQVWRERAEDFVSRLRPVLDYATTPGISLSADQIAGLASLEGLVSIVERRCLPLNQSGEICNAAMPADPNLTDPLRQYLGELPGYDPALPGAEQSRSVAAQHGYVLFAARHMLRGLAA